MKQSPRAKRLAKHHKRFKSGGKLNLVALMDIFTILVFFLIVNQSEVRVLQNIEKIKLPVSIAEELPVENLVITVLKDTVLIQERAVWQNSADKPNFSEQENLEFIEAMTTELTYQASKRTELTESEQEKGRAVTIIGDSSTPYMALKQIMAACAETGYRNMSLAVERQASKTAEES
ncbi:MULTISPECIES: biopolymer transporter ExbD [unclassified Shewanella]|uniref:ExbD/TolR family protein n=1 Tax=unclassified Shewanella TaxID=196818 RepID=UPI000C84937F|nr:MULTISPECIES: biopolymer transporter ExbD [unclassified Shewanella]MDO6773969.1 biopolymer transporter ExbD [Shewanella sp. 3_MG-2023]PMG40157.1 RNA polymerase subunit sigma-70 [Shewanella sp. 10N.286.52.B9]PMG76833.1 RNA polymerase subunit sigma-70 [Shewanella sp. 10N.286.51.B7]